MYVHDKLKLAYVAHPRTGSRETRNVLLKRGFRRVCGHHGVPWGPGYNQHDQRTKEHPEIFWWFNQPIHEWTIMATVRNHFDTFHSLTLMFKANRTIGDWENWLWRHPAHYRNVHHMWPTVHEWPERQLRLLRFESLRDDLSRLFDEFAELNPMRPDEFIREESNTRTAGKQGHYRDFLSADMVSWIKRRFGWEMDRLGYSF